MDTPAFPQNLPERPAGPQPENLSARVAPEQLPVAPELPASGEQAPSAAASISQQRPAALSADAVAAAIAAVPTPAPPQVAAAGAAPATAADIDIIEPEWVDKAEQVVRQHTGDPYGEEEAIEELQQDYLAKRYGYKVSNPNKKTEGT